MDYNKISIIDMIVKNNEMDLKALREARVPSKMKREMRRKYAKKYGTK
jgi:hypothetical protein